MTVIFLDIDGVLNADKLDTTDTLIVSKEGIELNKSRLSLFDAFIKGHPNLKIVMSTSWRDSLSVEDFRELFKDYTFSSQIIDKTSSNMAKAESIWMWISENRPSNFIILDDDVLFNIGHPFNKKQIKTSFYLGLTKSSIDDMEKMIHD